MSAEAKHLPRSRWSRKRKTLAALLGMVLFAVGGMALAALLLRGPITGGGSTAAKPAGFIETAQVVNVDPDGLASCTASATGGTATVNLNGIAGGWCHLHFTFRKNGSANVATVVQDIRYAAEVDTGFLPAAIAGNGGCGVAVPTDNSTVMLDVLFKVPDDAVDTPFTAQADAGIYSVSSSGYNPAICPQLQP